MAIARALSYNPNIILADEPTGNLDRDTQREIMQIFRELANEGKCVILVSYSPEVADMCDERYELTKNSITKEEDLDNEKKISYYITHRIHPEHPARTLILHIIRCRIHHGC